MDSWNSEKMLDRYIRDYMIKKGMNGTAEIFAREAGVSHQPVAIDASEGLLMEWWSVFWDNYCSRTQEKSQDMVSFLISHSPRGMENASQIIFPRMPALSPNVVPTRGNVFENVHPIVPKPEMIAQSSSGQNARMMHEQLLFPIIDSNTVLMQSQARFPNVLDGAMMHENMHFPMQNQERIPSVLNGAMMQEQVQFPNSSNATMMQNQARLPTVLNSAMMQKLILLDLLVAKHNQNKNPAMGFDSISQGPDSLMRPSSSFSYPLQRLPEGPSSSLSYSLQRIPPGPQQHAAMDGINGINFGRSLLMDQNLYAQAMLQQNAAMEGINGINLGHSLPMDQNLYAESRDSKTESSNTGNSKRLKQLDPIGRPLMIGGMCNATTSTLVNQTIEHQVNVYLGRRPKKTESSGKKQHK